MILNRIKHSRVLFTAGMWMLLVFNLVNFVGRTLIKPLPNTFADNMIDGAAGMMLGMVIATMFLAFRMKARETGR